MSRRRTAPAPSMLLRLFLLVCGSALALSCAARHPARGLVLKVDPASSTVTVSHEAIPGFMDAMVMPFVAKRPELLADVRPGDRIAFRVNVKGGRTTIDRVQPLSAAPADAGLMQSPSASSLARIGGEVPDFTLTNQDRQPVSLASLRGKVVAVTFIYTRCPLPDYCPRMVTNFDALKRRFPGSLGKDLELLTVTFDPQYDTPERLKAYAKVYRADVPGWHFLTGDLKVIEQVCESLGVEFWPEEGLITHTLQTAIVDRSGKLVALVEGKEFTPRQLGDLVELTLSR